MVVLLKRSFHRRLVQVSRLKEVWVRPFILLSGEAIRIQEPFRIPILYDRVKNGFCWVSWVSVPRGHFLGLGVGGQRDAVGGLQAAGRAVTFPL